MFHIVGKWKNIPSRKNTFLKAPQKIYDQISYYTNFEFDHNCVFANWCHTLYTSVNWEFLDVELQVELQANESVPYLIEYGDILMLI